jgi:beta-xylosidase
MILLRCTAYLLATCALSLAASSPFTFADLPGLEPSATVMRRDPSDIIKVRDRYYVWYTKGRVFHGYDATIWYATSADGRAWTERGEALARGGASTWDEQSVFTPNILEADGRFWLFFTAVPNGAISRSW